jgi:hypothetical protein
VTTPVAGPLLRARQVFDELLLEDGPTPCQVSERPDDWLADERTAPGRARLERAAEACLDCPVMGACLVLALTAEEPSGVWGGRTPADRRRMCVSEEE